MFSDPPQDLLKIEVGGVTGGEILLPGLPLHDLATGQPNRNNVSTQASFTGKTINIEAFKTAAE